MSEVTLISMLLARAAEVDLPAVVELVNAAYRGTSVPAGWTSEADYIDGPRLTLALLQNDLATRPGARLLTYRDERDGPLLGTVWLEPETESTWYLGLLTVRPDLQNRQLGRSLLSDAEAFAKQHGARSMRMTVVHRRDSLIAWYQRRGYRPTGETEPFPYHDGRHGKPRRDDLVFVVLEKELV